MSYGGCFLVEAQGHSGGLALIQKTENIVEIKSFSKNHIDAVISLEVMERWRLSGIYGEPKRACRRNKQDLFRRLKAEFTLPWCLIGDMNNLGNNTEKKGGMRYPNQLVTGFTDALRDCDLQDLEIQGYQFTWERGRGTTGWGEERLDKALVSEEWIRLFPLANLTNLEVSSSDHSPIFLEPIQKVKSPGKLHFRFENV